MCLQRFARTNNRTKIVKYCTMMLNRWIKRMWYKYCIIKNVSYLSNTCTCTWYYMNNITFASEALVILTQILYFRFGTFASYKMKCVWNILERVSTGLQTKSVWFWKRFRFQLRVCNWLHFNIPWASIFVITWHFLYMNIKAKAHIIGQKRHHPSQVSWYLKSTLSIMHQQHRGVLLNIHLPSNIC